VFSLAAWVLVVSIRGGGDMTDNPRYRVLFLVWMALVAAWAVPYALARRDPWFWRWLLVEGIFLGFFTQWYFSRYFHWGGRLSLPWMLFPVAVLSGPGDPAAGPGTSQEGEKASLIEWGRIGAPTRKFLALFFTFDVSVLAAVFALSVPRFTRDYNYFIEQAARLADPKLSTVAPTSTAAISRWGSRVKGSTGHPRRVVPLL
jgi:hypothetical protein